MKNLKHIILFVLALAAATAGAGMMERERGFRIGQRLTLRPNVSISYTYDTNVDCTKDAEPNNSWMINPNLGIVYLGDTWSLSAQLYYRYYASDTYVDRLNYHSYGETLNFRWVQEAKQDRGWGFILSQSYQHYTQNDDMMQSDGRGLHRDREQLQVSAALQRTINERWRGNVYANYYDLWYNNDYYKYAALYGWRRFSAGAEFGYTLSRWTELLVNGSYDWTRQDNNEEYRYAGGMGGSGARYGRTYGRDSSSYTVHIGVGTRATERISYRIMGGFSHYTYANQNLDDKFTYSLSANWKISDTMSMMALGSSYFQPSEREYGAALMVYNASIGLAKSFVRGKVTSSLDAAYRFETHEYAEYYEDDNYDETIATLRWRLDYDFNRYLTIFGQIEYQWEITSGASVRSNAYDYDRFRGTVGISLNY